MTENKPAIQRQFVNFSYYKLNPEWHKLSSQDQQTAKQEFLDAYQSYHGKLILLSYAMQGMRADCDLMLWRISSSLEIFNQMSAEMQRTGLGKYLLSSHSFLSMTKRSMYVDKIDPHHIESRTVIKPGKYKYIFVYPFVKMREWYLLSLAERQVMMDEHIRIGNKYPSVKLNTTYSFGLDDQDFVVAFESDYPADFLDLVMELRESQGSKYTVRDTPIFTCIAKSIQEIVKDF